MEVIEVSAIIPVYNDRNALEHAIPASVESLSRIAVGFEVIIAEDGSRDGTAAYAERMVEQDRRIRLLHSDERLGRGRALNRAISGARGDIVCYFDVDLATDMRHLGELVACIRNGYDIATGSRLLSESRTARSGVREFSSRGYNMLVRAVLGSTIHDHQCGFKAFNRERILKLLPQVEAAHWFWDTEILIRAQRLGYRIAELPVEWRESRGTTVKLRDIWEMGSAVFGLWWRLHGY
ncbi:MAG: glycosyltransferase family 2 protein [Methanomicrobiales archaeon]|nr:glycosyltransferase family 2 protein [Methanomicrobiales archaeon]